MVITAKKKLLKTMPETLAPKCGQNHENEKVGSPQRILNRLTKYQTQTFSIILYSYDT